MATTRRQYAAAMLQNIMSCAAAWLCLPTLAIAHFDPGPIRLSGEYPHQYETGIVLVSFRPEAANEARERALSRSGARSWQLVTPHISYLYRVRVADGDEDRAVERCRADPAVALARRNTARYFFGARAKAARLTQTIPYNVADSNAPTLWAIDEPGEADGGIWGGLVRIAIVDTGCNAHDDLPTPIAEENFLNLGAPATDSEGHGTAVAGVALARDNDMCYSAAAPAADLEVAKIDPEQGGTTIDRSIAAISWAINLALPDSNQNPVPSVRVINMSYGSSVYDEDEEFICNKALANGVVLVAACGNGEDRELLPIAFPAHSHQCLA